ncbi:MAG TPA: RnfH family protein [Burkholderiales bacterium]|nr:RnfH family protein [Burkholderiales bacterium]
MTIRVEVVYALPHEQRVVELELAAGARVADAIRESGIVEAMPGGWNTGIRVGIWGSRAGADTELRDGDRVEIYRELTADPKQARRQRAGRQRGASKRA